jgi:hypothetical protein
VTAPLPIGCRASVMPSPNDGYAVRAHLSDDRGALCVSDGG